MAIIIRSQKKYNQVYYHTYPLIDVQVYDLFRYDLSKASLFESNLTNTILFIKNYDHSRNTPP